MLKLRPRRGHDLRRTFITLAQVDVARRDLLETLTRGPRGDIINGYTTFPWSAFCAEVAKLKSSSDRTPSAPLARPSLLPVCYRPAKFSQPWPKSATPAGQSQ